MGACVTKNEKYDN